MTNDIDLMQAMSETYNALTSALAEYSKRGREFAEAQSRYSAALRQEDVAKLREDMDIAEALYKSVQKVINVYEHRLRFVTFEVGREYRS